jgi:bacillithiol system protein YtxJ
MFRWLIGETGKPSGQAVDSPEDLMLDSIRAAETAVIFKHSRSCPVSWFANAQVRKFAAGHPRVPVYTLLVQEQRKLSTEIAQWTGVRHESPQVIVLRRGSVVSTASHESVTADYLASALDEGGLTNLR